jgi:hypothetical protein
MFMKTLVHQVEREVEVLPETRNSGKKDGKHENRGKKKGDSKVEIDTSINHDDMKKPIYQWSSIGNDGQVFHQNSHNQEYEKVGQLISIVETNPATNEVGASVSERTNHH